MFSRVSRLSQRNPQLVSGFIIYLTVIASSFGLLINNDMYMLIDQKNNDMYRLNRQIVYKSLRVRN